MHRIDTPNARPNVNGTGKTGFHDNTDLSGQDATQLDPAWCNAVQEEIARTIEGTGQTLTKGTNDQLWTGLQAFFAPNTALDEVDSRLSLSITALSVAVQQAIIDERNAHFDKQYPIGTGVILNLDGRNPAVYLERGEWTALGEGTYLSLAGQADGHDVELVAGEVSGSYAHTITTAQMPNHKHIQNDTYFGDDYPMGSATTGSTPTLFTVDSAQTTGTSQPIQTSDAGDGEPIPIRPLTTTIYGWLRTG